MRYISVFSGLDICLSSCSMMSDSCGACLNLSATSLTVYASILVKCMLGISLT